MGAFFLVVEKPNGKLGVCLDRRPLNKAIKLQHLYLPTAEEILSQMSGVSNVEEIFSQFQEYLIFQS